MTDLEDDLRDYVGQAVRDGHPYWGHLLEHGCLWSPGERARPEGMRKLSNGTCFYNAFRRAVERGWRYVEGVAIPAGLQSAIAVDHAWAVDAVGSWPAQVSTTAEN